MNSANTPEPNSQAPAQREHLPRRSHEVSRSKNPRRIAFLLAIVATPSFLVGVFVAKLIRIAAEPQFWYDFMTGPPVAGLFALGAAGVAFLAANKGSTVAKESARKSTEAVMRNASRQEWWSRAEWALNLATSDDASNRAVGIEALRTMLSDAEPQEAELLLKVINNVSGGAYKSEKIADPVGVPNRLQRGIMKLRGGDMK